MSPNAHQHGEWCHLWELFAAIWQRTDERRGSSHVSVVFRRWAVHRVATARGAGDHIQTVGDRHGWALGKCFGRSHRAICKRVRESDSLSGFADLSREKRDLEHSNNDYFRTRFLLRHGYVSCLPASLFLTHPHTHTYARTHYLHEHTTLLYIISHPHFNRTPLWQ